MSLTSFDDIDFQNLWQKARDKRAWSSKKSGDWDKKAESFSKRNANSPYIELILPRLPLTASTTVLDIGCGPGTLSIPIAMKAARVTSIDYSPKMLHILDQRAKQNKIDNITTVNCSWEDNWAGHKIESHDIAIASRSLNVEDLKGALKKINNIAKKHVFLSDRISPTPFEPEVFEAVGRDFVSGPDYIYTTSILYQLGIHPNIEILETDATITYQNSQEALDAHRWMLKDLSQEEDKLLQKYLTQTATIHGDGKVSVTRKNPPRWALIWWPKKEDI